MRRWWGATLLSLALVGVAGCSADDAGADPVPPAPSAASPSGPATTAGQPAPAAKPGELAGKPLKHTVRSSSLTVDVLYTPTVPVADWTADGPGPVEVQVTLHNRQNPRQKIYLSRATMRFTLDDGSGDIPGPDPVIDTANITPGYLVTSPNSYVQSFAIPGIDPATRSIGIDLKLEMVSLVDAKAKDYTKQTVIDRVSATPSF